VAAQRPFQPASAFLSAGLGIFRAWQRFTRQGSDPFDRVRGLDALPRWDTPARHLRPASNTAWDVSNSAFEGCLYGTHMQSLTQVIWGACRTLDGPGFEPLISKASELNSFDGKESPEGIFRNGSLNGTELPVARDSPADRG
jgi:hypothetical protein